MERRALLAGLGAAIAGCGGIGNPLSGGSGNATGTPTEQETPTPRVVTRTVLVTSTATGMDAPTPTGTSTPSPSPTPTSTRTPSPTATRATPESDFERTFSSLLEERDVSALLIDTREERAELWYGLERQTSDRLEQSIDAVARAFAEMVGRGWPVTSLHCTVIERRSPVARYEIVSEWARRYRSNELSPPAYVDRIEATLEVDAGFGTPVATPASLPRATATPGPGDGVSDVTLRGRSARFEDPTGELRVRFDGRAQRSIDPDPDDPRHYTPPSGQKFLVVRVRIENVGDAELELTPSFLVLRAGGVDYAFQPLEGTPNPLSGVFLPPGERFTGWTVYLIPEVVIDGTVVTNQDAYYGGVEADVAVDPSVTVDMAL